MNVESYLIDGKNYSADETIGIFKDVKLSKREELALSLISTPCEGKTIVDLGCLYGIFGKALAKKFPNSNIVAGDYDLNNLKIVKLLHPELPHIFKPLNAYNLDLESNSVDCLLFQEVIEHLEGAANAVKEINRALKVGGELILSTPTPYYLRDMWQNFKYEMLKKYRKKDLALSASIYFQEHEWNRHIYCWTPSTLYTLLKVNGFDYIDHKYCQDGSNFFERLIYKFMPFLSPTIVMKVKKVAQSPGKIV